MKSLSSSNIMPNEDEVESSILVYIMNHYSINNSNLLTNHDQYKKFHLN